MFDLNKVMFGVDVWWYPLEKDGELKEIKDSDVDKSSEVNKIINE